MDDGLSKAHYEIVWAELQGRFFSQEEANKLKQFIDFRTVTDLTIRKEAAKAWK